MKKKKLKKQKKQPGSLKRKLKKTKNTPKKHKKTQKPVKIKRKTTKKITRSKKKINKKLSNKSINKKNAKKKTITPKKKNSKSQQLRLTEKKKKEAVASRRLFNKSPLENLTRPFNIIESYMGDYNFSDIYSILFVCTGNMCRSPIAEGLLKKKISEEAPNELRDKIFVHSSGIYAFEGNRPSENSVKVSLQNLVDISQIRSKPINRVQIEQSDLIFALSIDHLNFIVENFPSAKHKSTLLKTYGKERSITISDSIPDPIGFSMEFYIKTFTEIKNAIDTAFPMIIAAAQHKIFHKNNINP